MNLPWAALRQRTEGKSCMKFVRAIDVMGSDPRHERLPHAAYEEGSGWQNGRVLPVGETAISIRDEGSLRSTAFFDAVSTSRRGKINRFEATPAIQC